MGIWHCIVRKCSYKKRKVNSLIISQIYRLLFKIVHLKIYKKKLLSLPHLLPHLKPLLPIVHYSYTHTVFVEAPKSHIIMYVREIKKLRLMEDLPSSLEYCSWRQILCLLSFLFSKLVYHLQILVEMVKKTSFEKRKSSAKCNSSVQFLAVIYLQ